MHNIPNSLRSFESSTNRKILSNKYLHKEPEKNLTLQSNSTLENCGIKTANSHKRRRWQGIIKLRTEINKIETKKTIQRINETKNRFFEKINKIDKPLSKLIKNQRASKLTKSEMKRGI